MGACGDVLGRGEWAKPYLVAVGEIERIVQGILADELFAGSGQTRNSGMECDQII